MKRRLITSALPYVNNVPHLGNLIQVLSADAYARFCRLRGYETLYVCGTDEYGTATETTAAEEGITPRELCDQYYSIHNRIYCWFNISFDKFGRTSTPIQTEVTQEIYTKLDEAGFINEQTVEQLYCGQCKRFLADRFIRGICPSCGSADARGDQCESCGKLLDPIELKDPRCSTCGSTPSPQSTCHLYINLPKIKNRLNTWIQTASVQGFWANNAVQMTQAWIRDGLRERAITRDLKWGIPVPRPGYENKVFYVWFDAPIGYISITGCLGEDITLGYGNMRFLSGAKQFEHWREFVDYWWKSPNEVELYQFIGKDNIPFHTVIFPSSLLGSSQGDAGSTWTMLHHMSSTEYLNYESGKFSKSRGVGVFGTDVMETGIPADVWRFYLFYNRPEKADTLFTWKDFQEKVNGELIGNLGNLVNRTLSFATRYYEGKVPSGPPDPVFWKTVQKFESNITDKLDRAELRDAFREIFELSSFANKYFQEAEPWRLLKENSAKAKSVICDLLHVVRDLAILIDPFLPNTSTKIIRFFEIPLGDTFNWINIGKARGLNPSREINSEILFTKLEDDFINALRERYSGSQKERQQETAPAGTTGKSVTVNADDDEDAELVLPFEDAELVLPCDDPDESLFFSDEKGSFEETIDLRVAKIEKVERHPLADKLYVLLIEVGEGVTGIRNERTIVSGLVPYYTEDQLLGKHIIIVNNLKPAKLRGIESRGMLLAAEDQGGNVEAGDSGGAHAAERCEVLDAGDTPTGTRLLPDEAAPVYEETPLSTQGASSLSEDALFFPEDEADPPAPAEIDIDTFFSYPMMVRDFIVQFDGKPLCLNGKPVRTGIIKEGKVN
ncbi:MAG: methionine--tRNA ligase [Treponema sp.]|nr:methionine--tRNA ligase [Treponema sp.]